MVLSITSTKKRVLHHAFSTFNTTVCNIYLFAQALQERFNLPTYPTVTYPDIVSQWFLDSWIMQTNQTREIHDRNVLLPWLQSVLNIVVNNFDRYDQGILLILKT